MLIFILKKFIETIILIFIIISIVFIISHILPGDPVSLMSNTEVSNITIKNIRNELGLDQSLIKQFICFLKNIIHGNLGYSFVSKKPVLEEISQKFLNTFFLTIVSIMIGSIIGIFLGILSCIKNNSYIDNIINMFSIAGISLPSFIIGLLLIEFFSIKHNFISIYNNNYCAYILPSITLSIIVISIIIRITKISLMNIIQENYIYSARANGISEWTIFTKYALRNAMIPIITMIGLQFGFLLNGSITIEIIFNLPGMGKLLLDAVEMRDYPIIQASIILFTIEFVIINLILDFIYKLINPKLNNRFII
ncbi:ABC transporter permease subunit [Enterobacteriaceae endosymbiont of Plateumaris braccata]|uniref:ABC transporter permease subunit n=1 Tax=Enterobacteriaceae endosymbiont of Plateumaris braccata TaxID=2675793 RepID=UPI0014497735|nr:ABC transporter permease subunit [Enterobacteriaceae endosymbiont of Plateumaris braccata]QJC27994.1 ABC transporter permease subunit [Enterobacteriaceae endosymbiont of Plateumaris braccata]